MLITRKNFKKINNLIFKKNAIIKEFIKNLYQYTNNMTY